MKLKVKTPRLSLVGAGPGDPDLLTIKGVKVLASADAVLYDALVNRSLLDLVPKNAKLVFVGKRKGYQRYTQDEINALIVKHAVKYGHVVRLKGGDPFIFGRGSEEIQYAAQHGISAEVIPGISSSMAVPASQGIALTQRNIARSFWVVTGTTSSGELTSDIALAAQSTATVVILMGMNKLDQIVRLFKKAGKEDQAVAIIQNGTTAFEKVGIGTISTIESIVARKELGAPAIIVVGEVVRQRQQLTQFYKELQEEAVIA